MEQRDERGFLILTPSGWRDYELIDSGEGAKLERFGEYILQRPEGDAIWRRSLGPLEWAKADAVFDRGENGEYLWQTRRTLPERWPIRYGNLRFYAELTPFRHTGVFPEQAPHWDWLADLIKKRIDASPGEKPPRVLNLFGYTGIASLVAAEAGAEVTYLDASRPSLIWGKQNQELSELQERPIRWMLDDAIKFVRREARRGGFYDGIIMDPPVFGRGPRGEIWRFYDSFPLLLQACRLAFSRSPLFLLVNAYAVDASAVMLRNVLADTLVTRSGKVRDGKITIGELALEQTNPAPDGSKRLLPTGIFGRWEATSYELTDEPESEVEEGEEEEFAQDRLVYPNWAFQNPDKEEKPKRGKPSGRSGGPSARPAAPGQEARAPRKPSAPRSGPSSSRPSGPKRPPSGGGPKSRGTGGGRRDDRGGPSGRARPS